MVPRVIKKPVQAVSAVKWSKFDDKSFFVVNVANKNMEWDVLWVFVILL